MVSPLKRVRTDCLYCRKTAIQCWMKIQGCSATRYFNMSNRHRMWTQHRLRKTNNIENRYRMTKSPKISLIFKIFNKILMRFVQKLKFFCQFWGIFGGTLGMFALNQWYIENRVWKSGYRIELKKLPSCSTTCMLTQLDNCGLHVYLFYGPSIKDNLEGRIMIWSNITVSWLNKHGSYGSHAIYTCIYHTKTACIS